MYAYRPLQLAYARDVKLGEFDCETQAVGLATTQGVVPTVGMSGLSVAGGWGQLHGKSGLAVDNVIGDDVVTADGRLLTVSENENQDLFWGVRGSSGNVGVVTFLEFHFHEVGPDSDVPCFTGRLKLVIRCAVGENLLQAVRMSW